MPWLQSNGLKIWTAITTDVVGSQLSELIELIALLKYFDLYYNLTLGCVSVWQSTKYIQC